MKRSLLFWVFAGCLGGGTTDTGAEDEWVPREHIDDGQVCWSGAAGSLELTVVVQDCMSSSCSRGFQGACAASVDGSTIMLTSDISWEDNVGENIPCTDDCGIPMATCTLEGVADGTYTIAFGAQSLTIDLPSDGGDCGY